MNERTYDKTIRNRKVAAEDRVAGTGMQWANAPPVYVRLHSRVLPLVAIIVPKSDSKPFHPILSNTVIALEGNLEQPCVSILLKAKGAIGNS